MPEVREHRSSLGARQGEIRIVRKKEDPKNEGQTPETPKARLKIAIPRLIIVIRFVSIPIANGEFLPGYSRGTYAETIYGSPSGGC